MMKFVALFALIAVASAAPQLVSTPLLARLSPQPEAPANTEHATHVSAAIPVVAPAITYSAPAISYSAPIAYSAPSIIAHAPLAYAGGYAVGYSQPIEAHSYRISY